MIEHKKVVVKLQELKTYEDYESIKQDLEVIEEYCKLAAQTQVVDHPSAYLMDALGSAALVRYARIFKSGVRTKLKQEWIGFDSDELACHQHFIDLRDKHVSHSVNSYEDTVSIAFIEVSESGETEVQNVLAESSRAIMTTKNVWALGEIARKVYDYVVTWQIEERPKALAIVKNQPRHFIDSCKPKEEFEINPDKVSASRKSKK